MTMKKLLMKGWDRDILASYKDEKLPLLTVNMTGKCNFKCDYCHTDAGEKDPGELDAKTWKRILDESAALGNEVFWIGGKGEPLLDEAFEDVIIHANKKGLTTILNTNGTLISENVAKFLYDNNVSPEVKLLTFDEKAYDRLAGVKGQLPKLQKGLDNLLKAGYGKIINETEDARITRASGMLMLIKPAYNSMDDVFKFCRDNYFAPTISGVVAAGRVVKNKNLDELALSVQEDKKLLKRASEIMGYQLDKGFDGCHIQYGLFVQNNGDLIVDRFGMSCDVCDYQGRRTIGNLKEMSLEEGWKRIKEERKGNDEKLKESYKEFNCYSSDCFAVCPMALQSQKDYRKIVPKGKI